MTQGVDVRGRDSVLTISHSFFVKLTKRAASVRGVRNLMQMTAVRAQSIGWNEDPVNVIGLAGWGVAFQMGGNNGSAVYQDVNVSKSLQGAIKIFGKHLDVKL